MQKYPLRYRPDIDGLRAVAVLAVLFYHANLACSGGFVGVDIFFVISGYLITGLVLKDFQEGRFSLVEFWTRRLRRIFPALCVVIILCLIAGWFFFMPIDFAALGLSVCAQLVLAANFYFWAHSGYFEHSSETMPLLHTWSLAVEEQFYLLFPLLLLGLRKLDRDLLFLVLGGIALLSFGLSVWWSHSHASLNFYLLPTRAWELLLGGMATVLSLRKEPPPWLTEFLGWAGLLAIFVAIFSYNRYTPFPGAAALLPCLGAVMVIWSGQTQPSSIGKLLALPPVVFVGLISYSLYLWHWPLLVFARYLTPHLLSETARVALLLLSGLLATATWRFIEVPFRKGLIFPGRIQVWVGAGAMAGVLLVAGLLINEYEGIPFRLPPEARAFAPSRHDADSIFGIGINLEKARKGDFFEFGTKDEQQPIGLFVWGDSHAMTMIPILDALAKEYSVRGMAATHFATPPLLGIEYDDENSLQKDCIPFNDAVLKFIQEKKVENVVLIAKWGFAYRPMADVHASMLDTVKALRSSGARVWIVRQVPRPGVNIPNALALTVLQHGSVADLVVPLNFYQDDRYWQDRLFEGIAPTEATILDPSPFFVDPRNHFTLESQGKSLYFDDSHMAPTGAMRLRPLLEPIFQQMKKHGSPATGF
jgi:peptidoglycan/LPS O-acetylase OafA/YrhL